MKPIWIYPILFALSYLGVGLLRRWILRKNILDVPNERSSHEKPTPRGGGLIIVVVSLGFYLFAGAFLNGRFYWAYLAAAGCVAVISWFDDLFTISIGWRIVVHGLAALIVISTIGYWQEAYVLFGFTIKPGVFGAVITFCWIVWLTNAFNFMDGIDGLAAVQTVAAGIGWMLAGWIGGFPETGLFAGALAFSGLGFLLHNWQPAKIFMGDVGAAFLGFTFAVLPLLAANENPAGRDFLPWLAVGMVWLFVFDSLLTFFRRLSKKEKVWQAHREHIYQKLVIGGCSHRFVASLYGIVSAAIALVVLLRLSRGPEYDILFLAAIVILPCGILALSHRVQKDLSGSE